MARIIDSFIGSYDFLSNFYTAPTMFDGTLYPTSEHAYQAAKSVDANERIKVLNAVSAGAAKKIGRTLTMRPDWNDVKFKIMTSIVLDKFKRNPVLGKKLIATGNSTLIESNKWCDQIWGNCLCHKHKHIQGWNWLGKVLMNVREQLQEV